MIPINYTIAKDLLDTCLLQLDDIFLLLCLVENGTGEGRELQLLILEQKTFCFSTYQRDLHFILNLGQWL